MGVGKGGGGGGVHIPSNLLLGGLPTQSKESPLSFVVKPARGGLTDFLALVKGATRTCEGGRSTFSFIVG